MTNEFEKTAEFIKSMKKFTVDNPNVTIRILNTPEPDPLYFMHTVKDLNKETCVVEFSKPRKSVGKFNLNSDVRFFMPVMEIHDEVHIPQHRRKRWMSDAYHNRIQKKWNKRYATNVKQVAVGNPKVLNISESLFNKIQQTFANAHKKTARIKSPVNKLKARYNRGNRGRF